MEKEKFEAINKNAQNKDTSNLPTSGASSVALSELAELEIEAKANIRRTQSAAEINEFKLLKANEHFIPVQDSHFILNFALTEKKARFLQEIESLLQVIKSCFDLSHEDYVQTKKDFIFMIHDAYKDAVEGMKKSAVCTFLLDFRYKNHRRSLFGNSKIRFFLLCLRIRLCGCAFSYR